MAFSASAAKYSRAPGTSSPHTSALSWSVRTICSIRPSDPNTSHAYGVGGGPRSASAQRRMRVMSVSLRRATKPPITVGSRPPLKSEEAISATFSE